MTRLRDAALTALRLIPGLPEGLPIRARADHLGRKLRKALKLIGALELGRCNPLGHAPEALYKAELCAIIVGSATYLM